MSDATCTFRDGREGCAKPVEVKKWKLCRNHYQSMRHHGRLTVESRDGSGLPVRCSKGGCKHAARALGLCRPHLNEARASGELPQDCAFDSPPCGRPRHLELYCAQHEKQIERGLQLKPLRLRKTDGVCYGAKGECGEPIRARGMCTAHYYQWSRGLPLTPVDRTTPNLIGTPCLPCQKHGETRKARLSDGLCQSHYERKRKGQADWDRPIKHKAPNGAGNTKPAGYRTATRNGRHRLEHRVIAEDLLGRPLLRSENIHHRNGNRGDNRIDGPFKMERDGCVRSGNLEIWPTSQPAGSEIGPKLDWAAEMFDQYGQFHIEAIRRVAARSMAILGQVGTAQERKACATFLRSTAADAMPSVGELEAALF